MGLNDTEKPAMRDTGGAMPGGGQTMEKTDDQKKRMLLVDDSLLIRLSLESIIIAGGNGWQTVTAADGLEALAELENQSFDLIVTDYQMPNMDGLEFVAAVRQKLPEIPVVLVTGSSSDELQTQAQNLGVFCVLDKPVPAHLFLRAVNEASKWYPLC
jgi:CheY-like chemotaxis protein